MENDKKQTQDSTKTNSHRDMPIKNPRTDYAEQTAAEPGLNQSKTVKNNPEPAAHERDPDSSETD